MCVCVNACMCIYARERNVCGTKRGLCPLTLVIIKGSKLMPERLLPDFFLGSETLQFPMQKQFCLTVWQIV